MAKLISSNGRFKVSTVELSDEADIETAFETFYMGSGLVGDPGGVEHWITNVTDRIIAIEGTLSGAGNNEFVDNVFRLQRVGATGNKIAFSLVNISGTRTITLPNADFVPVGVDLTQSLTNKTLSGASNAISISDANFSVVNGSKIAKFDASYAVAGTTTIKVPQVGDNANSSLANTLVLSDIDQTVTKKTLGGYKESIYTTTNSILIDANLYNTVQTTVSADSTISFTNLPVSTPYTCSVILICGGTQRNINWPAGTIWSGGVPMNAIAANTKNITVITYLAGVYYASSLGAFS